MNLKFIRKGIVVVTLVSTLLIPAQQITAAGAEIFAVKNQEKTVEIDKNCLVNAVAEIQKEQNAEKTIKIESAEEIKFNDLLSGKVFVKNEGGYALVSALPEDGSDWTGKVYDASVVKIITRGDEWCEIQSGNVIGYVKTENLITGKDAIAKAKELLSAIYPERNVLSLSEKEIEVAFSVGESKEDEVARLAAEEAARIAEEEARIAAAKEASRKRGADLVSYAKQFIGNPYVYGGTSLTRGADCSGFVMKVYSRYGVSLPHSSYAMRRVGRAVSYNEIQPGDIVCYAGHVGIYAGNGQIVNALNENKGIVLSDAKYKSIITIRRIF